MTTLLFFLGQRLLYRDRLFATDELFCGPDVETAEHDGRLLSLKPDRVDPDIAALLPRLPAPPRLVVVKADAGGRNFPRNLAAVACPKVLILGDTHHMPRPIRTLIDYASVERFDLLISDHDRHHLHFFAAAGFPRVRWLPALNLSTHAAPPAAQPKQRAVFVGHVSPAHARRARILRRIAEAGLPLDVEQRLPADAARAYAEAAVSLNCSLNGDLNLRVFEVLAAGGLLLTDRLSRQSGLDLLLEAEREYAAYDDADGAAAAVAQWLSDPGAAARRASGARAYAERHAPAHRVRQFYDLVERDRVEPAFDLAREPRCGLAAPAAATLFHRIAVYEALQALHADHERLRIAALPAVPLAIASDAADLVRFTVDLLRPPEAAAAAAAEVGRLGIDDAVTVRAGPEAGEALAGADLLLATVPDLLGPLWPMIAARGAPVLVVEGEPGHRHSAFLAAADRLAAAGFRRTALEPPMFAR